MNKVYIVQLVIWTVASLSLTACGSSVSQNNATNNANTDASIGAGGSYAYDAGNKTTAPIGGSATISQGGSAGNRGGSGGTRVAGAGGTAGKAGSTAGKGGTGTATGGASGRTPSVIGDNDLVAAPDGSDSAKGTLTEPTTLTAAITKIAAGATIHVRGGSYKYSNTVTIPQSNSGSSGKLKTMRAYNDETPVLDFSSEPRGSTFSPGPRGLQVNGNYWHLQWIAVEKAADNGIFVGGSNNIIEGCIIRGNGDTGLQISQAGSGERPSNNLILNCESYDNDDSLGENADGFAAKLTSGPGNIFRGCVSHHNADDGWDLWTNAGSPIDPVTIDQCISHHNGTLTDGTVRTAGDRNGFKLGGASVAVAHIVTRSVAFANGAVGFTWNSNPGAVRLINNLSIDNAGGNYVFGSGSQAVFTNNLSFWTSGGGKNDSVAGNNVSNSNCWWQSSKSACGKGLVVAADDFANPLSNSSIKRNPDGSLDFTPFTLAPNSDLINAGVAPDGTLPFDATYYHDAPDLGAVEQ